MLVRESLMAAVVVSVLTGWSTDTLAATARAGSDQAAMTVSQLTLGGSGSPAKSQGKLDFSWKQVGGPEVALQGADRASASFQTPGLTPGTSADLVFELTVREAGQQDARDEVTVRVLTWAKVDSGWRHTVALRSDGTMWAWGNNCAGQIGQGNGDCTAFQGSVTRVGNDGDWQDIAAGHSHTLALKADGSLWAWGRNRYGQIGTGCASGCRDVTVPTRIGGDNDWLAIAAGNNSSFALKKSGELYAWGENSNGRLGIGDEKTRTLGSPTMVMDQVVQVSTSGTHTLVVRADGSLWGFGNNALMQLAQERGSSFAAPVQVAGGNDWTEAAAGDGMSFAIRGGELFAFGRGLHGALGLGDCPGTGKQCLVGVPTSLGKGWRSVSASSSYAIAIKDDGKAWAWGENDDGQQGFGDTVGHSSPTPLPGNDSWHAISVQTESEGQKSSFGLKADGTMWGWGSENVGQLGHGVGKIRPEPVQISTAASGVNWRSADLVIGPTPRPAIASSQGQAQGGKQTAASAAGNPAVANGHVEETGPSAGQPSAGSQLVEDAKNTTNNELRSKMRRGIREGLNSIFGR